MSIISKIKNTRLYEIYHFHAKYFKTRNDALQRNKQEKELSYKSLLVEQKTTKRQGGLGNGPHKQEVEVN